MNSREMKRQLNLAHWTPIIKECKSSGLSVKSWCKQEGVSLHQFYYWQRIIREVLCSKAIPDKEYLPSNVTAPTFVALEKPNDKISVRQPFFQPDMVLQSGDIRIELTNDTSMNLLSDVMKVMQHV